MANVEGRLDRLEANAAARQLRDALAAATDAEIARVPYLVRSEGLDAGTEQMEAIGFTSELVELAVGPPGVPKETQQRRCAWICADVLSEPRRSSIRRELTRLRGEA